MKTNSILQNNIFRLLLGTAAILMIPLLGGWPWTRSDFIVMGALVFGTGLMVNLIMTIVDKKHRVLAAIGIVLLALWLYVELAVGLFTNWGS